MDLLKSSIVWLGIGLVVGGLLVFFFLRIPVFAPMEDQSSSPLSKEYVLDKKEIKESGRDYSIDVFYPEMKNADSIIQEKFNSHLQAIVKGKAERFKNDSNSSLEDIFWRDSRERYPDAFISGFLLDYTITRETENLVSILLSIEYQIVGAAHPGHEFQTVNFDMKRGNFLTLKDFFKPNTPYLQRISEYCVADLKRQVAEGKYNSLNQIIKDGAGPNEENFRNFTLSDQGLTIHFEEYQVGPYAAGPAEVTIPLSQIQDLLNVPI